MQNLWTFLFLSNSIEIIMSFQKKCWCHYENDLTEKILAWYCAKSFLTLWKIFNLLPTSLRIQKQLSHSCPDVFCKKRVLWNFAKFTGKCLCQSLFFNKVAGLRQIIRAINSWLERQGSASAIFELKEIDSGNGSKRDWLKRGELKYGTESLLRVTEEQGLRVNAEAFLEPGRASMMELFCEKS